MVLILHSNKQKLLRGQSYWKIVLDSGKEIVEGQHSFDFLRGMRSVDWYLEVASTTDCAHISELILCTPVGEFSLFAHRNAVGGVEPYSLFQFKQGIAPLFGGERAFHAQIIGRVDEREQGSCTCIIWNALETTIHTSHRTTLHNFSSWRRGTPHLGAINYAEMGVRL